MSSKRKYPNRPESAAEKKKKEEIAQAKKQRMIKLIAGIICAVGGVLLGLKLGGLI